MEKVAGGISVRLLPMPTCARRMAVLIVLVVALDAAAAFFIKKPALWCALIPILIPIFTPLIIFSRRVQLKS